ncbi:MAG: AMP-binding protein [candidate division WS1 bacterium]|jgi:acetyl-CoA synthetase|nr:AMP-binding protein [candidate division WS1 bacterium]
MVVRFVSSSRFASYEDFRENFRTLPPDNFNFAYDVVDAIAEEEPDRLALVWCDEDGNEATFSYGDLQRESDRAAALFAELGIGRGDAVMLILRRRYEYWFCLLALHKLGAVAIPATHLLTTKDIVYRNNAADVKMIVSVNEERVTAAIDDAAADSEALEHRVIVGSVREGWLGFDEEMQKPREFSRPTGDAAAKTDDIMLLYFTSGTTGLPKMVCHDFRYPLGHILTAIWQGCEDGGLHLTVADTGWAKAAWGKIYGQWLLGSAVFVYEYDRFDPKEMLRVLQDYPITTFCAPPTVFRFLIKEDLSQWDLSSLHYVVTAGEPLNPEVFNRFREATGLRIMEGYGQTETVVIVATWPWMEPRPGSMGMPSAGWQIDLVDEEGRACAPGEEGQIVVRTESGRPVGMSEGYHADEELTQRAWRDGVYYTGDVAWRDEDGYYWFVGRTDDVIKSSGYRIGPFEVESALMEHPAVLECAVTGEPDPDRGAIVKATVVLAAGNQPSDVLAKELQEHVKRVTAPYKYPRKIEFVTELPKTISGKIRRVEIRGDKER